MNENYNENATSLSWCAKKYFNVSVDKLENYCKDNNWGNHLVDGRYNPDFKSITNSLREYFFQNIRKIWKEFHPQIPYPNRKYPEFVANELNISYHELAIICHNLKIHTGQEVL